MEEEEEARKTTTLIANTLTMRDIRSLITIKTGIDNTIITEVQVAKATIRETGIIETITMEVDTKITIKTIKISNKIKTNNT